MLLISSETSIFVPKLIKSSVHQDKTHWAWAMHDRLRKGRSCIGGRLCALGGDTNGYLARLDMKRGAHDKTPVCDENSLTYRPGFTEVKTFVFFCLCGISINLMWKPRSPAEQTGWVTFVQPLRRMHLSKVKNLCWLHAGTTTHWKWAKSIQPMLT